ncbi:uncharacterized protein MONOS_8105 [Monocercomonoides exilis]|uniref:uncharacterized protein n=1 Tax=Monocercomonoides exilis TaxID=2049356 RepID=UPI003559A989|nr:hypothetical protein MONOS_8105 [Monocercomonoides exilis]|eukprot:MONOS_8105.1-p1 / transcript=MONOS_8105.1 / gene=MONOS_8105 / organism=Monocercomonoides_exilis_PA203 / gene_product=unspecified product / transcript_product=unspecified product / location=Mono_scaffold00296:33523-34154(-) / protein_length=127 / sequence_SO=supercontig / SO=protein_coding / is_pseudo=false
MKKEKKNEKKKKEEEKNGKEKGKGKGKENENEKEKKKMMMMNMLVSLCMSQQINTHPSTFHSSLYGSEIEEKDESEAKRGVGFVPFKIIRIEREAGADGEGASYRQEIREINNTIADSRGNGCSSS